MRCGTGISICMKVQRMYTIVHRDHDRLILNRTECDVRMFHTAGCCSGASVGVGGESGDHEISRYSSNS